MRRLPLIHTRASALRAPQSPRRPLASRRAITLVELLVVFAILLILAAIVVPVVSRVRNNARCAKCLINLSSIGSAFRMYIELNSDVFPNPIDTGTQWEDIITPDANRTAYCCPADPELFPAIGSSYDWRDTGNDTTTLAGKTLSTTIRQNAVLAFDALPGWHAPTTMNAVLIDGSTQSMNRDQCMNDLLLSPSTSGR